MQHAGLQRAAGSLGLSPRETQVAELVVSGGTIKAVAARLGISPNTVKMHMRRIYRKLSVVNRAELCGLLLQPASLPDVQRQHTIGIHPFG